MKKLLLGLVFLLPLHAAFAEPLKVGLILPLSGVTADYGEAMRNSIELARKDRPELYRDIEFIYEDAQYDAKLAVQAFHKLRGVDDVDLVYTWGVAFCRALAPLADTYRLPTIGQCVDPAAGRGKKYFIRFQNYSDQYVQTELDFFQDHGVKNIGVVITENSYMEAFLEALERRRAPDQRVTVIERYQSGQMDVRSAVTKARRAGYDAIAVLLMTGQVSQFYRQLSEQNYRPMTFGTNLFESGSEIRAAGGAMDGALLAGHNLDETYVERYRTAYGNENQLSFGALAYEFTALVGELFGESFPKNDPEAVLRAFTDVKTRTSRSAGEYTFRETAEAGRFFEFELRVKRIEGDRFVELPPAAASAT